MRPASPSLELSLRELLKHFEFAPGRSSVAAAAVLCGQFPPVCRPGSKALHVELNLKAESENLEEVEGSTARWTMVHTSGPARACLDMRHDLGMPAWTKEASKQATPLLLPHVVDTAQMELLTCQ